MFQSYQPHDIVPHHTCIRRTDVAISLFCSTLHENDLSKLLAVLSRQEKILGTKTASARPTNQRTFDTAMEEPRYCGHTLARIIKWRQTPISRLSRGFQTRFYINDERAKPLQACRGPRSSGGTYTEKISVQITKHEWTAQMYAHAKATTKERIKNSQCPNRPN